MHSPSTRSRDAGLTKPGPADRLRAYAEHTLLRDMDAADLALLANPKLRDRLRAVG